MTDDIVKQIFGRSLDEMGRVTFSYVADRLGRQDFTLISTSKDTTLRFNDGRVVGPSPSIDSLILLASEPTTAPKEQP